MKDTDRSSLRFETNQNIRIRENFAKCKLIDNFCIAFHNKLFLIKKKVEGVKNLTILAGAAHEVGSVGCGGDLQPAYGDQAARGGGCRGGVVLVHPLHLCITLQNNQAEKNEK